MRRTSLVFVLCAGFFPAFHSAFCPAAPPRRPARRHGTRPGAPGHRRRHRGRAQGGAAVTVRLIGVDTPETVHPRRPVERFGREASAFLKTLIDGKGVRLEYEPGPSHTDKYGRTLAYLYLEQGASA